MVKTRMRKRKELASEVPSSSAAATEKKSRLAPVVEKEKIKAPAVEENLPVTEERLHVAEANLPTAEESFHAAEEDFPAEENTTPSAVDAEEESSSEEEKEYEADEEGEEEGEEEGDNDGEEESNAAEELMNEAEEEPRNEAEEEPRNEAEEEPRNEAEERRRNESADESDLIAIKPLKMCFPPSEYKKQIKVGMRCMLADAIKTLESLNPKLNNTERRWFEEHPQFKHLFHMKGRKEKYRVQAMWMLLLRTAETKKKKVVWFVVNVVPIRYGLREHALISGLGCRNYPLKYEGCGTMNFVKRHFKNGETKRLEDVKEKLVNMGPHRDKPKMAVLFFLGSVLCGQTKTGKGAHDVLEFFQQAVDDLDFCKSFPWGRYSFEYMLKHIGRTMKHFEVGEDDLNTR